MPFSIVIQGYPKEDVPATHVQGPAIQGMFLHLMELVDPAVSARLHDDSRYRPFTLSPLGVGEHGQGFHAFHLPQDRTLRRGTACYVRVTFLEDALFPTFSRYFLSRPQPSFRLGSTEFTVTNVLATSENDNQWSRYISYAELLEQAQTRAADRRISLRFVTPTSFSKGDVDLPIPLPRLVFQSLYKRLTEHLPMEFLPDFLELVDLHTGISSLKHLHTDVIRTQGVAMIGFIGEVGFEINKHAPPELAAHMNLLADFAFFCGTGKKTTVGMGQTVRVKSEK